MLLDVVRYRPRSKTFEPNLRSVTVTALSIVIHGQGSLVIAKWTEEPDH